MSDYDINTGRPIYERLPNETQHAWNGFCCYRDLGQTRTYKAAVIEYNKLYPGQNFKDSNNCAVSNWAKKYNWVDRVAAYDRDQERALSRALLDHDAQSYLSKIESLRANLENAARQSIANCMQTLYITGVETGELVKKRQQLEEGKSLASKDLSRLLELKKIDQSSITTLEKATKVMIDVYSIRTLINDIKENERVIEADTEG